jgi:hypothetical protein
VLLDIARRELAFGDDLQAPFTRVRYAGLYKRTSDTAASDFLWNFGVDECDTFSVLLVIQYCNVTVHCGLEAVSVRVVYDEVIHDQLAKLSINASGHRSLNMSAYS